jgi:hypothetical protein
MSVREIPGGNWQTFLEEFSRRHRGWLVTVDRMQPGTPDRVEAVERPIASITPEVHASRVVGIAIRFQDDSPTRAGIRIDTPTHVRVDETSDGIARGLEIVDEHDECVRVRFRAAPLPETLDGIAPGELTPK